MNKRIDINEQPGYAELDIALIIPDPTQPRRIFDPAEIDALAGSLQSVGFVHPVLVRQPDHFGRFKLVVGERRFRAAKKIGMTHIPAIIRTFDDQDAYLEMQLAENLPSYRCDWTVRERAEALRRFVNTFPTMEEAAARLHKSPAWLSQMLDILSLPPSIQALNDRNIVRDRITLISLKRLAQKDEKAAQTLIRKASEELRLPRAEVLECLALANQGQSPQSTATAAPSVEPSTSITVRHAAKYRRVARHLGLTQEVAPEILLEHLMEAYLALVEADYRHV